MQVAYSHQYNAVILPAGTAGQFDPPRFQISASRNDRETPRFISPAWTMAELQRAFGLTGISENEFQELLRGNRRGAGGRTARRILFTAGQLEEMGLTLDTPVAPMRPAADQPTEGEHAVFPES